MKKIVVACVLWAVTVVGWAQETASAPKLPILDSKLEQDAADLNAAQRVLEKLKADRAVKEEEVQIAKKDAELEAISASAAGPGAGAAGGVALVGIYSVDGGARFAEFQVGSSVVEARSGEEVTPGVFVESLSGQAAVVKTRRGVQTVPLGYGVIEANARPNRSRSVATPPSGAPPAGSPAPSSSSPPPVGLPVGEENATPSESGTGM